MNNGYPASILSAARYDGDFVLLLVFTELNENI